MDKKIWFWIAGIAAIFLLGMLSQNRYDLFVITGSETMTRTAASTVNPSSTFQVTYTAIGTSGTWGASIVDTVTGGCTFPAGTQLKTVMLSDEGTTKTVSVTAPASGTCKFVGDYQFGNTTLKLFSNVTVNICAPVCTRPADLCLASSSNGCGGTCTWTVTKKTNADTDCNNVVDRTELGNYITNWISGSVTRADLGQAVQAWAGG